MHQQQLSNLAEYILDYWRPAIDWRGGGIHYEMQDYGKGPVKSDRKCLLMHARQLYDFSFGTELGLDGCEKAARHLLASLDTVFPRYHQTFYHSFAQSSRPTDRPYLSAYDLYYTVIGLARYSRTFHDASTLTQANGLFHSVNNFFDDNHFPSRGCYFEYDLNTRQYRGKTGNTILHRLEALINIIAAAKQLNLPLMSDHQIARELKMIDDLFQKYIFQPKYLLAFEDFDADFKPSLAQQYGYATNSHILEWFGFWYEAQSLAGYHSNFMKNYGHKSVDESLKRGWDRQTGAFKNNHYLVENETAEVASFWSQPEAILGALYAKNIYRRPKYYQAADSMYRFYINSFLDRKFGGIYSDVTAQKIVINRSKGFAMKCDHHPIRMIDKIFEWGLL